MEFILEYQVIISSSIIIIGWFINNEFNRRHEIAKKRLDYRLKTLHSFLPVYISLTKNKYPFKEDKDLNNKLQKSFIDIQLYGQQEELSLFLNFKDALEHENTDLTTNYLNALMTLIKKEIRKELKLPSVEYT